MTVASSLEEVEVGCRLLVEEFQAKSLLDLGVLELYCWVVDIAVGVVFGEHLESFLVPVLGDEPTGAFWHPPDEGNLDYGEDGLDQGRSTPAPLVVDLLGAEGEPSTNDMAGMPQAVVDTGDTGTVKGMADLSEQQWRSELSERVAEAKEEART